MVLRMKCVIFAKIQSAVVTLAVLFLRMLIMGSYSIYECGGVYKTSKYNYVLNSYKKVTKMKLCGFKPKNQYWI